MRYALVLLLACHAAAKADVYTVYPIGNSLTWDAVPPALDGIGGYHIDCGRSLPYIYANPDNPCLAASTNWDTILPFVSFNFVTVQPYGGTVAENVDTISAWMAMQPAATFVLHTSWPALASFDAQSQAIIDQAEAIVAGLQAAHPGRTIYRDKAIDALVKVNSDVANNVGPFDSLGDLYRDALHMTADGNAHAADHGEGRYLIHNTLRAALGQPLNTSLYPGIAPATREYLHGVIANVTAVPEASQLLMLGAVAAIALGALGMKAARRR